MHGAAAARRGNGPSRGITLGGPGAANYALPDTATATANISPATLTYVADTRTGTAGRLVAGLGGTVGGLVAGDTLAAATTGTLAWRTDATDATAASAAGTYAIEGNGLTATNYVFQQAPGNASALTLTAAANTGDTDHTGGTGTGAGGGSGGGVMAGTPSMTTSSLAALIGQFQQTTPFAATIPSADDDAPMPAFDVFLGSGNPGLPVPYLRIIDGEVRMP